MHYPSRLMIGAGLFSIFAAVLMIGCEVTSRSRHVSIDPNSATIVKGQSITLKASGGDDYSWRLSDNSLGHLSDTDGDTVLYTSLKGPSSGETIIQTVTVVADVTLNDPTNSLVVERMANSYITHVSGVLSVSPSSVTLKQGQSITLTAKGSDGYTWTLETPAWGILSKESGNTVRYTSQFDPSGGNAVVQKITITAANGDTTEAFVTHSPGSIIQISPVTASLHNGQSEIFTIYGGSEYHWVSSQPSWGTITIISGNAFKYTSTRVTPANTTDIITITVTDISSAKAIATIYNIP